MSDDLSLAEQLARHPNCERIVAELSPAEQCTLLRSYEFWVRPSQRALLPLLETLEIRLQRKMSRE